MARRIDDRTNTITAAEFLRLSAELVSSEKDIRLATEDLAQARGVRAGIFKRAKAAGADVDAMRHLAMLAKLDDDERNRLLENVNKYADWSGLALWVAPTEGRPQGALFADDPAAQVAQQGLVDARITSDAFNSRRTGAKIDANPYNAGTRDHQTWAQAWTDADRDMANMPEKAQRAVKASTEPKPRGRPRKVVAAIPGPSAPVAQESTSANDVDSSASEPLTGGNLVSFPEQKSNIGWN